MAQPEDWKPFSSLHGFIRLILLVDWDPIGILGFPGALHQYDRYADEIYKLLMEYADKNDIERYLIQVQTERIEMIVRPEIVKNVASKIITVANATALIQSLDMSVQ